MSFKSLSTPPDIYPMENFLPHDEIVAYVFECARKNDEIREKQKQKEEDDKEPSSTC